MASAKLPNNRAIATLSSGGDLNAPPGSEAWAIAVRNELLARIKNTESDANHLQRLAHLMEEHAGYTQLVKRDGRPFASWHEFCTTDPPYGLGYDPDMLRRAMTERISAQERAEQPAILFDAHRPTDEERENNSSNTRDNKSLGARVDAEYLTARIARDRPDILERMQAGEYKSVRSAALDAGIVRARISIPADAEDAAIVLLKKFNADELQRIVEIIANHIAVDA